LNYRRFGRKGWKVSEIGHGMWGMGSWADSDDERSLEALQLSADLGCTFFDTAWGYGEGRSEALLGRLIRQNPQRRLYTATKIPPRNMTWPSQRGFKLRDCFPADHIREFTYKSLENARLDHFDLMQFHVWEDEWAEDQEWIRAMDDLKSEGVISATGISINRWEPFNGIKTVESGHVDAVQVIYNVFDQKPEDELFPACRENDVAVIARVPFDEGTLTGTLTVDSRWPDDDWRSMYFVKENLESSVAHADALRPLIPDGMSMPELALRFILNNPDVSTIIPGMRKLNHVRSNTACSTVGPLSKELHRELKAHRWDRTPTAWSY